MRIGKLSSEDLKDIVLDKLPHNNEDILVYPKLGEDCGAISFGEQICVATTDPITASESEIGRLAVHINCNDIASSGAKPIALLTTILLPPSSTEQDLMNITTQINDTASKLGVSVIGGHTEVTEAVNKPLISATAIGKIKNGKMIKTSDAKPDDMLVMTKNVALEGTAILAYEYETELSGVLTEEELNVAKSMMQNLSVVKEGVIGAESGVNSMHDVTEGGIVGAIWEMCEASDVGCIVYEQQLPINPVTLKICEHFDINPLKLISSGVMLMSIPRENYQKLRTDLEQAGIEVNVIGEVTSGVGRYFMKAVEETVIEPVCVDEIYKVCK